MATRRNTLHDYWRSSAACRVRVAHGLLQLPHGALQVKLQDGCYKRAQSMARNPQGPVPTFRIDGLTLTQSIAILKYLDETRAAGLLPQDPADRAQIDLVACPRIQRIVALPDAIAIIKVANPDHHRPRA